MAISQLFFVFLAVLAGYVSAEQQVLSAEPLGGVLRRFTAENGVPQILAAARKHDLDVWHAGKSFVDIYSPPESPALPAELLRAPHSIQQVPPPPPLRLNSSTNWNLESLVNSTFHDTYHPLPEIQTFVDQLVAAFPNTTHITKLGHTAENRDMFAVTISSGPYQKQKAKPRKRKRIPIGQNGEKMGFVIIGAQHAREWVATSTSLYLAHALLVNSSESSSLSKLLDHFDFHFIPVPNPDGYDYTWTTDRYWYKNRQVLGPYTKCVGLDMNRNWGYKWEPTPVGQLEGKGKKGKKGKKPKDPVNPCSHWYPGSRPFESYEVNNIANWVTTLPNLAGFIDLRSYGQMLSAPYSYSCKRQPKDAEDQIEAALGATQALHSVHGTSFDVGSLCSMLYPAPGNILDWMYSRESIKYAYVAHLRDTGTYGFSLPEKWIRPTGEETSHMVEYLAKFIIKQARRTGGL